MAGVFGNITNNLMGMQQLAAGQQAMQQNQDTIDNNRIAAESLRKYNISAQNGAPDDAALQEAFLRSPDLSQRMLQGAGIVDKRKGQEAADYAMKAYQFIDNPDDFLKVTQNRIDYLQSQGRDATQTIGARDAYLAGKKDEVKKGTALLGASLANQGYLDKDIYGQVFGVGDQAKNGVASSQILDDGTTVQVLRSGQTKVTYPQGNEVTGEARAQAVRNAQ
jgi:hypothetical protein